MRDISSKRSVILLSLIAGVLALIASGRAWINGTLNDGVLSTNAVDVTGNQAIPGYFGIALVSCAGLLAAATAGRIARWPAGVISLLGSIAMVALTLRTLLDPASAVKSRMSSVTGHTGEAVARGEFTVWFWVAVFAALLALLSSVLGLLGLRRWHGLSSRYEAPVDGEAPKRSEESDWDLMSRGVDPTDRT
ncbi:MULTISPECIES: Trp biosynthesis-associated membrane protein [Dermacoccus]|uniref:Trp biosynthesis-associated membrane protein n=2 Tax=Dermacoccus TaxID=57495 RepID=A0A417ZAE6_9MICO|nr:Trp biosynthesis-associated membrane protein [Dermacoccus abyssi]RHW47608.1 hypothetical protein D1832_02620 [Dermacoccus abyssi]